MQCAIFQNYDVFFDIPLEPNNGSNRRPEKNIIIPFVLNSSKPVVSRNSFLSIYNTIISYHSEHCNFSLSKFTIFPRDSIAVLYSVMIQFGGAEIFLSSNTVYVHYSEGRLETTKYYFSPFSFLQNNTQYKVILIVDVQPQYYYSYVLA